MHDQFATNGVAPQEELLSLQDENVQLLADKQTYTHTNARPSAELGGLTARFEDALIDEEESHKRLARLANEEGRLHQEDAMERGTEIERDSMDRTCNVLTNMVIDVTAKHQEVDRLFERSSTKIPTAPNINTVGQSDRMAQVRFTESQEARGPLSDFRRRSDDICDDSHKQENMLARTEYNSSRDSFNDGPMAGPSDVTSSSHRVHSTPIAPVREPVDLAKEFKFNSKEELVKVVRVLNEQMALVARTATILTSPASVARGETRPGRRESVHPYLHSRLLDILGVDLFHRLQIRTEDDTQNPSDQVERAIQATFFYLLSIFARTWSLVPSPLTSKDVLGDKTGRRKRAFLI